MYHGSDCLQPPSWAPQQACLHAPPAACLAWLIHPASCVAIPGCRARQLLDQGVKPDASTFNCLLKACMRARDVRRARIALQWMAQAGVAADEITYNTLVKVRGG